MHIAVWGGARWIRAFKARNSWVFASVLHHQRARLCWVCYSLFSTSCLPHAHGFCFLVPLAPWPSWLLLSLMVSFQLITPSSSQHFLVHDPEDGCHLFKPDHTSVHWSACALPTCGLISVAPGVRGRVTRNKLWLPKGCSFSIGYCCEWGIFPLKRLWVFPWQNLSI